MVGLEAAIEAVFMPGAQLIHSGPFLIQGVCDMTESRVGYLFFKKIDVLKGGGALPSALPTTALSTAERSGGS